MASVFEKIQGEGIVHALCGGGGGWNESFLERIDHIHITVLLELLLVEKVKVCF